MVVSGRRFSLRTLLFLWGFTNAQFAEMGGNFAKVRAKLGRLNPPNEYVALRDSYDAKVASVAYAEKVIKEGLSTNPPTEFLQLLAKLRTRIWYLAPKDENECYAVRYLDYLTAAVVFADGDKCKMLARELNAMAADPLDKKALPALC